MSENRKPLSDISSFGNIVRSFHPYQRDRSKPDHELTQLRRAKKNVDGKVRRSSVEEIREDLLHNTRNLRTVVLTQQRELHSKTEGWCLVSTLKPYSPKGYVQPSIHDRKPLPLHVLSFIDEKGFQPDGRTLQVSHLCHTPACFNPEHLIAETPLANNNRKNCLVWIDCQRCKKVWRLCKHEPPCIKYKANVENEASVWSQENRCTCAICPSQHCWWRHQWSILCWLVRSILNKTIEYYFVGSHLDVGQHHVMLGNP